MKPGPSDIMPASLLTVQTYDHSNPTPFLEFLAVMEAQWEGRDTRNTAEADAVVGFCKYNPKKDQSEHKPDGTKSTLNIFAHGRYAHPLPSGSNEFDIKAEHRSGDVVVLDEETHVGYKRYQRLEADRNNPVDYVSNWEETTNGRFANVPPTTTTGINSDWKQSMKAVAQSQHKTGLKGIPILALFGVDVATPDQLTTLKEVTVSFLEEMKDGGNLMLSGKRDKKVADNAEAILTHALENSGKKINFVTGYADGVDSIPARISGGSGN